MNNHILKWHSQIPIASELDINYRGTLLSRILAMQKQTPIALNEAVSLMVKHEHAASAAGRKGADVGHVFWYSFHFIEWLETIGYHIELTGDEFDAYLSPQVLS